MAENESLRTVLLLGDPVAHSLSPVIHQAAFEATGVRARYLSARVPSHALQAAVEGLRSPDFLGANVTIPHKERVAPMLDELDETVRVIGAVNTIVRLDDGRLRGHNTDVAGFLAPLDETRLQGAQVVVIGSGGAARAVIFGLLSLESGVNITVAARTIDRAGRMVRELEGAASSAVRVLPIDRAGSAVRAADMLVNATPVGMHPDIDATPWPESRDFQRDQLVYDLVYAPSETRLLREAALAGADTMGGLPMLIGQAAASFSLWTGRPFPTSAAEAALKKRLA